MVPILQYMYPIHHIIFILHVMYKCVRLDKWLILSNETKSKKKKKIVPP